MKSWLFALFALAAGALLPGAGGRAEAATTNEVQITSLTVDGRRIPINHNKGVSAGSAPQDVVFGFEPGANSKGSLSRIRFRLEGLENNWNVGAAWMYLAIRFYNEAGDQIGQTMFTVAGESAGWNGSLKKSTLAHRRETVVVPPQASRVWVVISSAGPPDVVGIYVVANLVVSRLSGAASPGVLIQSPFDNHQLEDAGNYPPQSEWMRDGNIPSMAKVIKFGQDPEQRAFAIIDDSLTSHAEWHTSKEAAPKVTPGEQLVVEWNEMYSMGMGGIHQATYQNLPTGTYHFQVAGLNTMGIPSGDEDRLTISVPQVFWKTSWFRIGLMVAFFIVAGSILRYTSLQRMRREMVHLKNQQALERERLRIAHDIHDDLGARVTQISLLSAMSQGNANFSGEARTNFEQISQMSRELVSALYQTVWAVNPENDNLDALGNYICQMVNQMCERVQFRCRLYVADLPTEIQVSSQIRHNVSMAVKEAVHNVIKHARATEVKIHIEHTDNVLTVSVQDDGCGFQPADNVPGHGLGNMKRRLADIGGSCSLISRPGHGTTVRLCLDLPDANKELASY